MSPKLKWSPYKRGYGWRFRFTNVLTIAVDKSMTSDEFKAVVFGRTLKKKFGSAKEAMIAAESTAEKELRTALRSFAKE